MPRILPALLLLLGLALAAPAGAQVAPPADGAEAGANAVPVQPERLEALIATLEDDAARAELVAQLRLLLEAQAATAPADESASFGDQMLGQLSQQFAALGDAVDAVLATPDHMVDLWVWLEADVATESGRSRWQDILRTIAICLGAALVAFFVLRYPMHRLGLRLARPGQSPLIKLLGGGAGFLLDALPVIAFAAAGSASLAAIEASVVARVIAANLLGVLTIALATCALIRILTRPRRPAMRLLPVSDAVACDLTRRLFWIVGVMTAAYAVAETLPLIGMPGTARSAFLILSALIAAVMLIAAILKHRLVLRYAIERGVAAGTVTGDVTRWLAARWHAVAILLVVVLLITYIVGGDTLFVPLLGQLGLTLLVTAVAVAAWQLAMLVVERRKRRAKAKEAPSDGDIVRKSGHVLLQLFAKAVLALAVVALLIHVWLFDIVDWLGVGAGRDLLQAAVTIGIIVGLAYAANRAIAAVIDRIQHAGRPGTAEQRRRRAETLLPLLRNAAAVIISAVALLIILSEIGLDITPLLASAGVIGIAIGFGAQSLVKDVITGLFILMEDAVGVGDVVTVAGRSGVVEEMSIRSIKLRDFGGILHVIPFGVVDATSNMTRDFAFAVFEVGVAYDSDVDTVKRVMAETDDELRTDPELRPLILEPIQIFGVDSFGDNAVVIKARIKTRPGGQWNVLRAYNGLLKKRFDAEGIEIPFPQRTLHIPRGDLATLAALATPPPADAGKAAATAPGAVKP